MPDRLLGVPFRVIVRRRTLRETIRVSRGNVMFVQCLLLAVELILGGIMEHVLVDQQQLIIQILRELLEHHFVVILQTVDRAIM